MKRRSFLTLLPACALANQLPAQEIAAGPPVQVNGFTIAGVAVNAATKAPLSKALVRIAVTDDPQKNRLVVTGPDGRFQFTNLPAQKFALSVERASGPPHLFLADDQYSTAIVTGPGLNTSSIVFPYQMPGAISGTVLDDTGEPVPSAQVHVFARQVIDGAPHIVQSGTTNTRNSGAFTVGHLKPGIFFVGVSGQPWYADRGMYPSRRAPAAPTVDSRSALDLVYPFTYYGGTVDPAAAAPITVNEGGTANIQIVLRAIPAAHVTITSGDSQPGSQINVQAMILGPDGHAIFGRAGGVILNGQGELGGLAPGRYQLMAQRFNQQGVQANIGRKIVDIADGATIDVSSASRISVKADVKIEGNDQPQNRLSLLLQDRTNGNGVRGIAGPDGVFQFRKATLAPGQYRLLLPNTPAFHVQSITAKGARIVAGEVLLADNSDVMLSVVITRNSKATKLEGYAVRDNIGVVGAMVLLLPQQSGSLQTYRDQTDSDGSFGLPNVAAGKYIILAIDNGHDLAYAEPEVLKPYLNAALPVSIADPTQLPTLKVPVQTRQS